MASGCRKRGGSEIVYRRLRNPEVTTTSGSSSNWDDDNSPHSGPALTVDAFVGRGNRTDLRLNLQMDSPLPPGPALHRRGGPSHNIFNLLPSVEAPEGANQIGGGGGGSRNGAYADATLETNKDLSTVVAHYKTQLEEAGCVVAGEGQDGPLAWNTWTLKEDDEQGHGFFVIMKVLDQEYYLTMRMRSGN